MLLLSMARTSGYGDNLGTGLDIWQKHYCDAIHVYEVGEILERLKNDRYVHTHTPYIYVGT